MTKKNKEYKVQNNGVFDDLNIIEDDEIQNKKTKKLDMFRDVLPNLDKKNYNFYDSLSEAEKKGYAPLVIMQWMSSTNGDHNFMHHKHLLDVNEFVNIDFWNLSKHPELQHKLLCLCGAGTNQRHQWIPLMKKNQNKFKCSNILKSLSPNINDDEMKLILQNTANSEFEQFLKELGYQDKELKDTMKLWKEDKKRCYDV